MCETQFTYGFERTFYFFRTRECSEMDQNLECWTLDTDPDSATLHTRKDVVCYILRDQDRGRDRVVGKIYILLHPRGRASISWLAIHSDYWRRGLGTRLLQCAMSEMKHVRHWSLHVAYPSLVQFYTRLGFRHANPDAAEGTREWNELEKVEASGK